MTQLPEPTFWEWVGFAISMACLCYGAAVIVTDRLPDWARGGARQLLFQGVPAVLIECLRILSWVFGWIGAGVIWLLSAGRVPVVDEMLGRRHTPPAVNTFSPDDPDYVADGEDGALEDRNETTVAATTQEPLRPIANVQGERNEPLTRNVVTRAQADIIARLLKTNSLYISDGRGSYKQVGQVALIRLALGLEPNGRPDSDYGRLKAELDPLIKPELTVNAGRPDERVLAK